MNFLMWTRPQRQDIDGQSLSPISNVIALWQAFHSTHRSLAAIEALGNPGWNWERFYEYSKKTERCANSLAAFHPRAGAHSMPLQSLSQVRITAEGNCRRSLQQGCRRHKWCGILALARPSHPWLTCYVTS